MNNVETNNFEVKPIPKLRLKKVAIRDLYEPLPGELALGHEPVDPRYEDRNIGNNVTSSGGMGSETVCCC